MNAAFSLLPTLSVHQVRPWAADCVVLCFGRTLADATSLVLEFAGAVDDGIARVGVPSYAVTNPSIPCACYGTRF